MASGVVEKHHEAFVHVVLLVAVEQSVSGIVGCELDVDFGFGFDEHYIFNHAANVLALWKAAQFETVPVQVDGVIVAAGVLELEPIALAMNERSGAGCGPGFAVDHPVVGRAVSGEPGFEDERDVDYVSVAGRRGGARGEDAVIPDDSVGLLPCGFAGAPGVFDDNAHAGGLDVLAHLAQNPDAGIVHFDDGADALGGGQAQHGNGLGIGNWIAVESDDAELVTCERDPMLLGRTGVEDVQEDALSVLDAQRFAKTEDTAVDGGKSIFGIHRTVSAAGHLAFPVVKGEEEFLVVVAGVVAGLDEQKAMLAGVLRLFEVCAGEGVGVVPAEACRAGRVGIARLAAGGDHRRAFFHGAIDIGRQKETVPMNDFFVGGVVGHIDGDLLPFPEAKQRAGDLLVVGDGLDGVFWGDLKRVGGDVYRVICGFEAESLIGHSCRSCRYAAELEEAATSKHNLKLAGEYGTRQEGATFGKRRM